ncbi:hypothetical protein H8L32_12775 [Undibacterium sp. CY18W]|uniref:Oxalate:formate antiporter n=1 Tax=Undibacterium hunanense TaxID=2762292 RepID=A0ABR6ZR37_9BURK|nr:hypothetical protein [Undibacterium hunanense]MBC3918358.1 hypothetical protein [Undibacterium hunanense]
MQDINQHINQHVDPGMKARVIFFWTLAGVPLAWGVWQTGIKVMAMFA